MYMKYEILFSLFGVMRFVSVISPKFSLMLQALKSSLICVNFAHII